MSTLFGVTGAIGLLATLFPPFDGSPPVLITWLSIGSIAVSLVVWIVGSSVPPSLLHVFILFGSAGVSLVVAVAATAIGIAIATVIYIWIAVSVGRFFRAPVARAHVLIMCVLFGVALLLSDVPHSFSFWPIYASTLIITAEIMIRLSDQLRREASRDPLTGLLNRHGLEQSAEAVLASFRRTGLRVSLAVIDLDDFKAVNDHGGHVAGDRLLAELATSWLGSLRTGDILARFGGDEFVLLMPDTELEEAGVVLERLDSA